MKKILYILSFLIFTFSFARAQDEQGGDENNGKLKERFKEYMQKRLDLSKDEAERAFPYFLRYLGEIKRAHTDFPNDALKRRQRIIEVKLRFRDQVRETVKARPERLDPDKVERAAVEFRKIVKDEADKRNLPIRRRGGSNNLNRLN